MFMHPTMSRFPMTRGALVKIATVFALVAISVVIPIQFFIVLTAVPVLAMKILVCGALLLAVGGMVFTIMLAPQAVRLEAGRLIVERWLWSDFRVPLRQLTAAELGPEIRIMGSVRRVFGNGGLMGFTGLYHVANVGMVRCWATQRGTPTVLVYRTEGLPLLLGVDDARGLLAALQRAGVRS